MLFQLVPGGFSYQINQNNSNSNWKKILGFRKKGEKLEKLMFLYFAVSALKDFFLRILFEVKIGRLNAK